jgi:hypothetical protein
MTIKRKNDTAAIVSWIPPVPPLSQVVMRPFLAYEADVSIQATDGELEDVQDYTISVFW